MSNLSTTQASTTADDAQRARRLPPELLARTNADLDELCQLRAQKAQAQQRGKHAGTKHASRVQQAITTMAKARALQLSRWTGSNRAKCMFLRRHIAAAIRDNNGEWHQLTKPPHWTTISKVINGLHNVSTQ